MSGLLSKGTVGTVGLLCKTFLNIGYCASITVNGIENLRAALESDERNRGRGVVTIANHISTLDDPLVWGILPARFYLSSRLTRWTLGASDIMFTNPIFSYFFRNGQVIETFRGNGIFQPAIDHAIAKLNGGAWIHLFGEGKVNQSAHDPTKDPTQLLRFKWGVGRILMETIQPPIIIPMWLTGFDELMPENRSAPWKFLPKAGVSLSVTFGNPVNNEEVREALGAIVRGNRMPEIPQSSHGGMADPRRDEDEQKSADVTANAWLGAAAVPSQGPSDAIVGEPAGREAADQVARVRSAVTALLQRKVEELGRKVVREKTRS